MVENIPFQGRIAVIAYELDPPAVVQSGDMYIYILDMRVLELFSGTHSVGKVCDELGWECISLDLAEATLNIDIMKWDYKAAYPAGYFDIVWASSPCTHFSNLKRCNIGRPAKDGRIFIHKTIEDDIQNIGLPMLRRTEEIIDYFQPKFWFLENPQTARTKNYIDRPFYTVDYCMYGMPYRKRTNVWTNLENFTPRLCNKQCGSFDGKRHIEQVNSRGGGSDGNITGYRRLRISIPAALIRELFAQAVQEMNMNHQSSPV